VTVFLNNQRNHTVSKSASRTPRGYIVYTPCTSSLSYKSGRFSAFSDTYPGARALCLAGISNVHSYSSIKGVLRMAIYVYTTSPTLSPLPLHITCNRSEPPNQLKLLAWLKPVFQNELFLIAFFRPWGIYSRDDIIVFILLRKIYSSSQQLQLLAF